MTENFNIEDLYLGFVDIDGNDPFEGRLDALEQIAAHLQTGQPLNSQIKEWFCDGVKAMRRGYEPNSAIEKQQRFVARVFGFTRKQGNTVARRNGYEMAKEIQTIKVMESCGADEAIRRYVSRRFPTHEAEKYETVRQTYYRHRAAVEPAVEAWLAAQEP